MPYEISNCKETKLGYNSISTQMNFLKGKVLTVIDASIQDRDQRKAVKDLIHDKFKGQLDWIYQLCGLPEISDVCNSESIEQKVTTK